MPFLPPNQQRQSTESSFLITHVKQIYRREATQVLVYHHNSVSYFAPCPHMHICFDSVILEQTDKPAKQLTVTQRLHQCVKRKGSPYWITERRVPELIPVLGSQPAGDVSHKPDGRLALLSARPAVTPAILKRAATSFTAW